MTIAAIFVIISSLLMAINVIPYLIDVIKGNTKPKVVSWSIWALLELIALSAAIVERQYPTAILMLCAFISTSSVAILGWKYSESKKLDKLDTICLIGAAVGILVWIFTDSPDLALTITVTIDFIGSVPTVVHSWRKPYEETAVTYVISFFAAIFTLLAVDSWRMTALAYPIFLTLLNFSLMTIIFVRKRSQKADI